ncbi:hypothetical protein ACKI1Q_43930, partial [Streptomyces galilaeus]|uniref:hypothetical protein n=1 Tax=Streptomyces galilaeus TaxID=33899 RepID=UPI0038F750B6
HPLSRFFGLLSIKMSCTQFVCDKAFKEIIIKFVILFYRNFEKVSICHFSFYHLRAARSGKPHSRCRVVL